MDSAAPSARAGQVAVVIGASGGLGLGMATRLAADGMRLVVADIEKPALEEAERMLRAGGADVLAVQVDIAKQDDVDLLAHRAVEHFGTINMVCSTVGVGTKGMTWEVPYLDWQWIMAVNMWGVVHIVRSFIPILIEQEEGHLLITSSTSAVVSPIARSTPYLASKHAVMGICEGLQQDLRALGSPVKVSVILPGAIRSKMASGYRNRQPEFGPTNRSAEETAVDQAYLDTEGTPGDILADRIVAGIDAGHFYLFGRPQDPDLVGPRSDGITSGVLPGPPPIGPQWNRG